MRAQVCIAVALLGLASCASPLAAVPLAAQAVRGPTSLAAPMEDGSLYVLAEGGPLSSARSLARLWRREAGTACQGEYMVMSEREAASRRGGVVGGRSHEGFVRCMSPEAMDDMMLDRKPKS